MGNILDGIIVIMVHWTIGWHWMDAMDGGWWMAIWMAGWLDGWMDGWMDAGDEGAFIIKSNSYYTSCV